MAGVMLSTACQQLHVQPCEGHATKDPPIRSFVVQGKMVVFA